ncbi:MAG: sugar ABC transporter substrate-binding protein [Leptolyngbya sp.]|nr:MAG: sugar ABC transporter substrate-binding protein [Leptolyngbya sp.]
MHLSTLRSTPRLYLQWLTYFGRRLPVLLGCLTVWALILPGIVEPAIAQVPQRTAKVQSTTNSLTLPEGDGYLLGAGDRVKIDVFSVPEITGEYTVLPNGTLNMPLVGAVGVQNRTLKQASSAIAARYAPVLQIPVITVNLVAARPIRVAIAGEVNRPGSYTVTAATSTDGTIPTMTRLVQLAEGVTQVADLRQVQVRRVRPVGSSGDQVVTVDLWQLLQAGDLRQDLRLQDGDSILIPATATVNLDEARQLASANFATRNSRPLKITVVGEVNRPGPYTLLEGNVAQGAQLINPNLLQVPSITRAIQVAGGITQLADIRNIEVKRFTRSGTPQLVKLDLWKLLKAGDALQDLPLQDGDTVTIPQAISVSDREISELATASFSPERISVNVVGEVERPGAVSIQPNTPLNQAILTAGGFNRKAKMSNVSLIRVNPNGTVSKRDISIDLTRGVDGNNNPALRNNDIIIVKKTGFATFLDSTSAFLGPFTGILGVLRIFGGF